MDFFQRNIFSFQEPELHNHTAVGGQEKFYTTLALFISSLLGFGIFFTVIKWKSKWKNDHKKPNLMSIQPDNNEGMLLIDNTLYLLRGEHGHISRLPEVHSDFSARGLCSGKPNLRTHTRSLSRYTIHYLFP